MSFVRRTALALGVSAVIAGALRLRGSGGVPPQKGGWRELTDADLTTGAPSTSTAAGPAGSNGAGAGGTAD